MKYYKGYKPWNAGLLGCSGQTAWNKGRRLPKWYRRKLSEAHKGKTLTHIHKKRISKGVSIWSRKHPRKSARGLKVARSGAKLSKPQLWLFHSLRSRAFHPKLEYSVGRFWIDIALVSKKIAIEVDGSYWHKQYGSREVRRDRFLRKRGWRIIHVNAKYVKQFNMEVVE